MEEESERKNKRGYRYDEAPVRGGWGGGLGAIPPGRLSREAAICEHGGGAMVIQ